MGIKVKVNGSWEDVYQNAEELPLGTILMWHKSLEARAGTARETGTATTDTTDKLIDSSATFVTNSVAAGDIVYNSTDSTYATVQSVDSETQLTLDWDAFPDGNEAYSVYPEPDVQPGWIEMDGSTISDADSPFNGMTIEDVVGSERFFRARETAGRLQADAFQGHWHRQYVEAARYANGTAWFGVTSSSTKTSALPDAATAIQEAITDGPNGTPRTADETRPINISFVPIVKIKNSGDVKLATYYSVSGDNFSTLTELTSVEDADEMVIYDSSASVYKKVGIDTLRELTPPTMIVEHQETSGTDGGGSTSGSWQKRTLNQAPVNEIAGASLASSQITLPAGTYEWDGWQSFHRTNTAVARVYDTTGSAELGTTDPIYNITTDTQVYKSSGFGRFTLSTTSVLEFQYRVETAKTTNGLGNASGWTAVERFAQLRIRKVA